MPLGEVRQLIEDTFGFVYGPTSSSATSDSRLTDRSVIGWSHLGVVTLPDSSPLFVCVRRVQRRYQLIDFGRHDRDDVGAINVDGGERVCRTGGDGHVLALLKNSSFGPDEDFQTASKDNESLVGMVVPMRWSLVSRVVGQVPSPYHEVAHVDERIRSATRGR